MNKHLLAVTIVVIIVGIFLATFHKPTPSPTPTPAATATATPTTTPEPTPTLSSTATPTPAPYADPIADFKARITKKMFGTYVTPQNSPVQPERFTGYHTGDDVEYGDVTHDVPVYAIADGVVQEANTVSGYGGLLVIKQNDGLYSLYGHMRVTSLPKVGKSVKKGDQVGMLGTAFSTETDGERRHLHFAIYKGNQVDIKGYVQNKGDLSNWIDPLSLY